MRQPPHLRRIDSSTRRLPAALLLLLVVVAQISSLAHLALVPHVLCLEHGEFVESGERTRPAETQTPELASVERDQLGTAVSQAPAVPEIDHGHEHCLLASHHRGWAALPESRSLETLALATNSAEVCGKGADFGPSAAQLLRLAPKTSPPV